MCAGGSVGDSDVGYAGDGEGVVERAVRVEEAAVAVACVFTEADVGDEEKVGKGGAEEVKGLDDGAVGIVGGATDFVFDGTLAVAGGDTEDDDGAETFGHEWTEEGN